MQLLLIEMQPFVVGPDFSLDSLRTKQHIDPPAALLPMILKHSKQFFHNGGGFVIPLRLKSQFWVFW